MYHTTYIDNCIVLRHADNHTKHVQYHVIPTTALDNYSTAIYRQPHQKITSPCHTNAMWYVTSHTISASIVPIHIRRMSPYRQSSTRQTYSVVVTDRWKDEQINRNVTLCGLYLCSVIRLPQYTIIFSHCPTTAVHQHTTERPHCSLLEFSNRVVSSEISGNFPRKISRNLLITCVTQLFQVHHYKVML